MLNNTILGVDIGGTNIKAGLIRDKKIIKKSKNPTGAQRNKEEILKTLFDTIDEVMCPDVQSIGIGVPGLLDLKKGQLQNISNIPAWKYLPLRDLVKERYNIDVFVNNDANCLALGEKHFGKGQDVDNMIAIALGTGVGSGIVLNNKLVTGLFGGAGEIGCIPFQGKNFEYFCSSNYFIEKYQSTGEILFDLANNNDARALEAFNDFGRNLGKLIHTILYFIAPEKIVLGGSISNAFTFLKEAMMQEVNEFPFEVVRDSIVIEKSDLSEIAILGAAAQYYNSMATSNMEVIL
jgi:glucokinase